MGLVLLTGVFGVSVANAKLPPLSLDMGKNDQDLKKGGPVSLEADQVSFSQADNKAHAEGKVEVSDGNQKLYCDQLEMDRNKQEAVAKGHVYLDSPKAQIDADQGTYNFNTQSGNFTNARAFNNSYQVKGKTLSKISDDHMAVDEGYMTTCDHDEPHFRMGAHRMDIYQGDKAVAHGVKMYLGKVPVMYLPRYTQDLKNRPWFTFTPGSKKDLGLFLLTRSRIYSSDHLKTTLHVDFYERQGIGWGMDNKYKTDHYGGGIVRNYFINERAIAAHHPWLPKTESTVENERYKLEWRHKWDIDNKTNAIWQYYRLSDDVLLKKYFEREYRQADTSTFFLLTRALPHGNVSLRVDHRVNKFNSAVDRTPEITYENGGEEIGSTGFYAKTTDSYVDLVNRFPSPTEVRQKTRRIDTNNELYYPTKVAFIEARPFVGGEHTYYSREIDEQRNNRVRGVFRTGVDLSTKFYKMWDYKADILGMKIDRLRHVVTPTVAYIYQHRPTIASDNLNQFDAIDTVDRIHKIGLGLENKLQTKRNNQTVDLARLLVSSDFALKENPGTGGFSPVSTDLELKPTDWLTFNADAVYDHKNDRVSSANFDSYINGGDKWTFGLGRRYSRGSDDLITTEWFYKINPKWKIKLYDQFTIDTGVLKVEDYMFTRDLHEWEMDFDYHTERGAGSSFLVLFRLKAFPDMNLNLFETAFHQRKSGSQSSTGEIGAE